MYKHATKQLNPTIACYLITLQYNNLYNLITFIYNSVTYKYATTQLRNTIAYYPHSTAEMSIQAHSLYEVNFNLRCKRKNWTHRNGARYEKHRFLK